MEDKLTKYRKKRDFAGTPEPSGVIGGKSQMPVFVVQKHQATNLHYDFRIEIDGVLKSWAVPKCPSLDPKDKRLAVPTEDHPLEYKDFEGIIPEGHYGAGQVSIWDRGTYENVRSTVSMAEAFTQGKIEINLHGEKLKGKYALIRIQASMQKGRQRPWLLIKVREEG